jgi:adenosylmethionine-8-amino-7-oxononanoate aminotransferase
MDQAYALHLQELDQNLCCIRLLTISQCMESAHILCSRERAVISDDESRCRILDGLLGLWGVNVGHGCEAFAEAVSEQSARIPFYPSLSNSSRRSTWPSSRRQGAHVSSGQFLKIGCGRRMSGSQGESRLLETQGTPAQEKLLSRTYSYYSVTLASASMTGLPNRQEGLISPFGGFLHAPAPSAYRTNTNLGEVACREWCIEETRRIVEKQGAETTLAFFIEPI